MAKDEEFYMGLISRTGAKQKFLELCDAMVLPYEQHYAMLQGQIGSKYAPNSGIRVIITEYGGDNKVTGKAKALVPTYVFEEIHHICLRNKEETVLYGTGVKPADQINRLFASAAVLMTETRKGLLKVIKEDASAVTAIGAAVKQAWFALAGVSEDKTPDGKEIGRIFLTKGVDYSYHQDRVHTEQITVDGSCSVDTLDIQRKTFSGNEQSRIPWEIRIANFQAEPVKNANGTDSYNFKTKKNIEEHVIKISDNDMSKISNDVIHFVRQWESANLTSFIKGLKETERRRREFLDSSQVDGRYSY